MGTSFANLQVRDFSIIETQKLLPNSLVYQFNDGWTTVVRDDFQIGMIEREGRALSKKIDKAVLTVGYFDDDVLALNIFRNGKNTACHISDNAYGYTKKIGNPTTFAQELELNAPCKEYLKWIFKCEDLPKKVELLQKMLGIPLWIDYKMLGESSIDDFKCESDINCIELYVKEKKKADKIKNITKATLLTEFEGMFDSGSNLGYFLINHPSEDGEYYMNTVKLYTKVPDGSPTLMTKDNPVCFESHSRLLARENLVSVFEDFKFDSRKKDTNTMLSIFKDNGDLLAKSFFPKEIGYPMQLVSDGSVIFYNNQFIYMYDVTGTKKWELDIGYLHVHPTLYNDFIYLHYECFKTHKSEILKINKDGMIEARFELRPSGGCHWKNFLFDNHGNLYYCCSFQKDAERITKLFLFDDKLQKISDIELEDISYDGIIDIENKKIYAVLFQKAILTIDINSLQVCMKKKHDEFIRLFCIDSVGNIILGKGSSTIEILNTNLNIVSRNRLKGNIYCLFKNSSGNICIMTGNGANYDYGKAAKSLISVYEIEYL